MTGTGEGSEALELRRSEVLDISEDGARQGLVAIRRFQAVVREILVNGTDYGTIPGCGDKPTLLKPGAEKIAKLLKCFDHYEFIERIEDWDKPLFHYLVRCTLSDMATETKVSSGIGEANSMESKHRFRWIAEDQLPAGFDKESARKRGGKRTLFEPAFAIEKKATAGQYGKPMEHWLAFEKAIANRTARASVKKTRAGGEMAGFEIDIDTTLYQVPNPDIFDSINTLVKMAKKRALVDATLSAGRLSELFTQDLEDIHDEPGIVAKPSVSSAAQAEYEEMKAKPLGRVRDEFDPPDEEKPPHDPAIDIVAEAEAEVADPAPAPPSPASCETFAKIVCDLKALGISEEAVWTSIHRYVADTFKKAAVEISDFSTAELDAVNGFLHRKKKATEADRAKKVKANG